MPVNGNPTGAGRWKLSLSRLHWAEGWQVVRGGGTRIPLDSIVARYRQGWTPQNCGKLSGWAGQHLCG